MDSFSMTENLLDICTSTPEEMLRYLEDHGIIVASDVEQKMKEEKFQEVLRSHPYKIWQSSDGRWCTYAKDDNGKHNNRKKIVKATQEQLNNALLEHYAKDDLNNATLESIFDEWAQYKTLHLESDATVKKNKADWRKYLAGTDLVKAKIVDITTDQLDIWAHKMIKKHNWTKKQYINVSCIIRQELEYAVTKKIIPVNPMRGVSPRSNLFRIVKKKPDETQVLTKSEFADLKKIAWSDFQNEIKDYVLSPLAVIFMFLTGIRISEVTVIRFDDIVGKKLIVQRMLRRDAPDEKIIVNHTKGNWEYREVPICKEAENVIEAAKGYQLDHGIKSLKYIFAIHDNPKSFRGLYRSIGTAFDKYYKTVAPEMEKGSHKARKTFTSTMIEGGVNINVLRGILGHQDERTTYNNYCFGREQSNELDQHIESVLSNM